MVTVQMYLAWDDAVAAAMTRDISFSGERTAVEVYYDAPEFAASRHGYWLCLRGGRYELQIDLHHNPMQGHGDGLTKYYSQMSETEIIRLLSLPEGVGPLVHRLRPAGYFEVAKFHSSIKTYPHHELEVGLLSTDFGYRAITVTRFIEAEQQLDVARREITQFLHDRGVTDPHSGYRPVVEFLRRHSQPHFQRLVSSGVVH